MELYLLTKDLINSDDKNNPILKPTRIPIHPDVYNSDFAYTPKFMEEVKALVLDDMQDDLSRIERILGKELMVEIKPGGFGDFYGEKRIEDIEFEANPEERTVGVEFSASSIDILPLSPRSFEIENKHVKSGRFRHPLPLEKARAYAFNKNDDYLELHTWYGHNMLEQGDAFFHFLRAFTIRFNNLGLTKL